eukprot:TRINITY_DN237_c1_g5_i1.p6 TRINITY_DN237_c1_g5~~TRINITY_DN237_c1_g5_i1.p6  ORF type:complete len:116 (+),score=30.05 TRINITY_DN237_c1_g5_i1:359-706(+)
MRPRARPPQSALGLQTLSRSDLESARGAACDSEDTATTDDSATDSEDDGSDDDDDDDCDGDGGTSDDRGGHDDADHFEIVDVVNSDSEAVAKRARIEKGQEPSMSSRSMSTSCLL